MAAGKSSNRSGLAASMSSSAAPPGSARRCSRRCTAQPRRSSSFWTTIMLPSARTTRRRRGRDPRRPRPSSTGDVRWPRSSCSTWSRRRRPGRPPEWRRAVFYVDLPRRHMVLHDGVDTRRLARSPWHATRSGPRSISGRLIPDSTRVVSFVARSLERLRGFDRFLSMADAVLQARPDTLIVIAGDPIVRRGLDVAFHNKDYPAHLMAQRPSADAGRLWFLGMTTPSTVAEVLAASDLHVAPGRPYPVLAVHTRGDVRRLCRDDARHQATRTKEVGAWRDGAAGGRRRHRRVGPPRPGRARRPGRVPAAGRRRSRAGPGKVQPGRLSPSTGRDVDRRRRYLRESAMNVLAMHDAFPASSAGSGRSYNHAARLEMQLPGAEPLRAANPDAARCSRSVEAAPDAVDRRASHRKRHPRHPDLRAVPRPVPLGLRRAPIQAADPPRPGRGPRQPRFPLRCSSPRPGSSVRLSVCEY